jgi:hypothetical protein
MFSSSLHFCGYLGYFFKLKRQQRGNEPPRVKGLSIKGNALEINEFYLMNYIHFQRNMG